ncbi:MAG: hypothetical protein GY811_15355 [Myxococcales bacterium]|nr:hypothetical protein [Myxococcales bacterium]
MRECLETLLVVDSCRALPFVAAFLNRGDIEAECAALALGSSRLDGAFQVLQSWQQARAKPTQLAVAALAIATLRSDEALDHLFRLAEEDPEVLATSALRALAIYAHDTAIRDRAEACVASNPILKPVFDSEF